MLTTAGSCERSSDRMRREVSEAASEGGPRARLDAVAAYLWQGGGYDHRRTIGDSGARLSVISERTDPTTFVRQVRQFKRVELRAHAVRMWRLFRALGPEHPLREVQVTLRIPVRGDDYEGTRPYDFLMFAGERDEMAAVDGFTARDPYDITSLGFFDRDGERFVLRLVRTLTITRDGSLEMTIE